MHPVGSLRTQQERNEVNLRQPDTEVENYAGGFVSKISDLQRLQRFTIIGTERGTYYAKESEIKQQNIDCLDRIIADGKGEEAVRMIEDISVNRQNVKQTSLLTALAECARCNDRVTKKAAYSVLPSVCRIPTFLFEFVQICQKKSGVGKGWGRAPKKALTEWYKSFKDNPEKLARLITKFKSREGWTHKDVLRLAHAKVRDCEEVAFILRYIVKGFDQAKEMYMSEDRMDGVPASLQKVADYLNAYERALSCREVDHLVSLIREYKLTWEQCPTPLLQSAEVWKALLPHMPIEAMIRNLGRMTKLGIMAENSQEEETAVNKINSINKMTSMHPVENDMETDESPKVIKRIGTNFYHPFKILVGLVQYKAGKGAKGRQSWSPNQRIVEALDTAFYRAFEYVEPTNKKYYLAVDVSGSMSQPVMGSSTITCATAAAAMLMQTVRSEENTIVKGFSHVMRPLEITTDDDLRGIMHKVSNIMMGATDCALPMMDAIEHKIRDIDVFVIYTDNETWFGKVHPSEALKQYRLWSGNQEVKLVVCGMCATEFSIANPDDLNMLDIVGFDSGAPRVISMFVSGQMSRAELSPK